MGNVYKVTCQKCRYNTTLELGSGLLSVNKRVLLGCLDSKASAEMQNAVLNGYTSFIGEKKPAYRCKCGYGERISEVMIISASGKTVERRIIGDACPACREKRVIITDFEDVPCPKCRKGMLAFEKTGHWD